MRYYLVGTKELDTDYWPELKAEGFIGVGGQELGDLTGYASAVEIREDLSDPREQGYAKEFFTFSQIKPGDVIIAFRTNCVGIGVVTGEYYRENRKSKTNKCYFPHRFPVNWVLSDGPYILNSGKRKSDGSKRSIRDREVVKEITEPFVIDQIKRLLSDRGDNLAPTSNMSGYNLNTILYGPPGTGKTYSTTKRAVELANPGFAVKPGTPKQEHKQYKDEFDRLAKEEQIIFITFHQSYSYQDFIYGIRPKVEGTGNLEFEEKDGIFYELAERARNNYDGAKAAKAHTGPTEEQLYKLAFDAFLHDVNQAPNGELKLKTGAGYSEFTVLGLSDAGRAIDFRLSSNRIEKLSVRTLYKRYQDPNSFSYNESYFKAVIAEIRRRAEEIRGRGQASPPEQLKNYILVIDEINRANISAVFGELITAIEEDKRYDMLDYIPLHLPNGDLFAVPPNLYILGTMNTADKSIALVDIALRRRFYFEAMYPQYEIPGMEDHGRLLKAINGAVYKHKKSADFLIGHASFIGKPKNKQVDILNRKVIPLLMEYFPNKLEIVQDILSSAGVAMEDPSLENGYQIKAEKVA